MKLFKKQPTPTIADKMDELAAEEQARQTAEKEKKRKEIEDLFYKNLYPKIMADVEITARKGFSSMIWMIPKSFSSLQVDILRAILKKDGFSTAYFPTMLRPDPQNYWIEEVREAIDIDWRKRTK